MRYEKIELKTNSELINENAKVNLKELAWEKGVAAMNCYMFKNLKNYMNFMAYREEEDTTFAILSYDEKKVTAQDTYNTVFGELMEAFGVGVIKTEPYEITMMEFLNCLMEGRRRDNIHFQLRLIDNSRLWIYYTVDFNSGEGGSSLPYKFTEYIIPDEVTSQTTIFDTRFTEELKNIETHECTQDFKGNMVHYILSARSTEAAVDMVTALGCSLLKANRISSRRIDIVSELKPNMFEKNDHLEDMLENNSGGIVVFNLTGSFGTKATQYTMVSKYLEKLFIKYRNKCLFVFSYNIDSPGFSYYLLPQIQKYAITVPLREGTGDRAAAIGYMSSLIGDSDFSQYADQAEEFMELYPGDSFTQTDVLAAYERFDPWCMNKNFLHAYNYSVSDGFMLDRDENAESAHDRLNKLIGLGIVKKQIESIIASDIVEKERRRRRGIDYEQGSMHMIFAGNPGTAKTTVAKLFAGIAKEKGILKSGIVAVRGGMDLDGLGCVGAIREAFLAARGGVLFIDEAYSMCSDVAITALIQEMENQRDEVIVVLAGYNERMKDFMELNEGLKSRVPHWIDFPDYTAEELDEILKLMVSERGFTMSDEAYREAHYIFEKARCLDNFGNGRYVRNLLDRAAMNQSVRVMEDKTSSEDIEGEVLFHIEADDISTLEEGEREERPAGTARKELDGLIGLSHVKEVIHKAIAHCKYNKMCMDRGMKVERAAMHMVFTGNPGTAKTTVARLYAEIMKDEGILQSGVFVEAGRADLIGPAVGTTAPLVKRKFKEAQGGVLFIDEAYSLVDGYKNGYGDEAISTIVQEMENHRDDVIVVFAGYPEPMREFIEVNPGMKSRIAFQVEFDDYSTDELCDITRLMLEKKQLTITDEALEKLRVIYDDARKSPDYGNGRFVRGMLEEAQMNMAVRATEAVNLGANTGCGPAATDGEHGTETGDLITTIEACDIPETEDNEEHKSVVFGFAP